MGFVGRAHHCNTARGLRNVGPTALERRRLEPEMEGYDESPDLEDALPWPKFLLLTRIFISTI